MAGFLNYLGAILIGFAILLPFLIPLSVCSLHYHAAFYQVSPQNMNDFLARLTPIARWFYSRNIKRVYYNVTTHSSEQIAASLRSQRYLAAVLPAMFIFASCIGIFRTFLAGDYGSVIGYLIFIILIWLAIRSAWLFGSALN